MAPLWLLVLTLLPLTICSQVPAPEKLWVQALNTNYTLRWSWGQRSDGQTVSFIVQYRHAFHKSSSKWRPACETSELFCDLNPLDLFYLSNYSLQVRASVDGLHSDWTGLYFNPAKQAAVGPPTRVKVSAAGNTLEVSVTEPQTIINTSMKKQIRSLYFRFMFWEKERPDQRRTEDSPNTLVALEDLSSWTWYCVSVQSRTTEPDRSSVFTEPVCVSSEGGPNWGKICLYFGASLCFVFVVVLGITLGCFHVHRVFKNSFIPSVSWPVFLDQLHVYPEPQLLNSSSELQCDLLTVNSSSELQCDLLTVNSSSELQCDLQCDLHCGPLTVNSWSAQQENSSVRLSVQSSEDSGIDSSISSSSGQSSTEQSSSGQSSGLTQNLTHGPEVSLSLQTGHGKDLTPKSAQLITDEGFVDSKSCTINRIFDEHNQHKSYSF